MASREPSFEDLLQCSICLERFTQPKTLPCSHTFCLSCLRGLVKDAKSANCPTCRKNHQVPEKGVTDFPDNLVVKSLLDMLGESTACHDCDKRKILSECEHCQKDVCSDCRVAHNVLQAEVSLLIQSLELVVLKNTDNTVIRQAAQTYLNKTDQVKINIRSAFDEAVDVLKERKEGMIERVEIVSRIHAAVADGTGEALVGEIRQELSGCDSKEGLKRMKESLMRVEEMLSGELEFIYDMLGVVSFGELKCGGETMTEQSMIKVGDVKAKVEKKPIAKGDAGDDIASAAAVRHRSVAVQVGGETVEVEVKVKAAAAKPSKRTVREPLRSATNGIQTTDVFPTNVDYQAKSTAWKRVITELPTCLDRDEFSPTDALYSQHENIIYCLSNGELIKFDVASGNGKAVFSKPQNAVHFVGAGSKSLFLLGNRSLKKAPAKALDCAILYENTVQTMTLNCDKAVQICSHRKEVVILDSGKKSLLKFNENGKLVQEIRHHDFSSVSDSSRMCVDKHGRIYVSGVRIIGKNDNADGGCSCGTVSKSVKVGFEIVISILTWNGQVCERQLVVDRDCKDYPYAFNDERYHCRAYRTHNRRNDQNVDDLVMKENGVTGLCVDGDGYLSVAISGKNQIDVYDPKHKFYCSIGGKERPEFKDPRGLTLMPDGRLVVCDTGNKRIQIV